VVREEGPKKKGWFSRKEKPSNPPQNVSRPPSAASFGKKPQKSGEKALDGDLPPRLENGTPPPSSDVDRPSSVAESVESETSDLPVHAGFDFKAIKAVIGEAEAKDGELRVALTDPLPVSSILPPSQRSDSEPRSFRPSSSIPSPPSSPDTPPAGNKESQREITSQFARSMSLNDLHNNGDLGNVGLKFSPSDSEASQFTPRSSVAPSLSFSDKSDSLWSASTAGTFGPRSPPDLPSFGNSAASLTYGPSALAYSPTTNDLYSDFLTPVGLSFGGPDGLVTAPSVPDPWSARPVLANDKKSASFNANPWS
jgi:hypothetical protein